MGEIYQYIIHPKKGAENKYSSIQKMLSVEMTSKTTSLKICSLDRGKIRSIIAFYCFWIWWMFIYDICNVAHAYKTSSHLAHLVKIYFALNFKVWKSLYDSCFLAWNCAEEWNSEFLNPVRIVQRIKRIKIIIISTDFLKEYFQWNSFVSFMM